MIGESNTVPEVDIQLCADEPNNFVRCRDRFLAALPFLHISITLRVLSCNLPPRSGP